MIKVVNLSIILSVESKNKNDILVLKISGHRDRLYRGHDQTDWLNPNLSGYQRTKELLTINLYEEKRL